MNFANFIAPGSSSKRDKSMRIGICCYFSTVADINQDKSYSPEKEPKLNIIRLCLCLSYPKLESVLWNRNRNRRNRNFLTSGTGTGTIIGKKSEPEPYLITVPEPELDIKLCICLHSFKNFFIHILQ
jgi:hypothetical protein